MPISPAKSPIVRPDSDGTVTVANVPDGLEGLVLGDIARQGEKGRPTVLFVARDGQRLQAVQDSLAFFAPEVTTLEFPAWDCMPYDRVSPNPAVQARRMAALARLASSRADDRPAVVLTTANAVVQRLPARDWIESDVWSAAAGNQIEMESVVRWLDANGFLRTPTVREPGEYAVRGGIVDLFVPGSQAPVRLDFFGDTLESIRPFDPETQRTTSQMKRLDLVPMSEVVLGPDVVTRFRTKYREQFGAPPRDDLLYQSVSEGRRHPGIEHWLPLFHDSLDTLFDYVEGAATVFDHLADEAIANRQSEIADHYEARREGIGAGQGGVPYNPVEPAGLYLEEGELKGRAVANGQVRLTPFSVMQTAETGLVVDAEGRVGRTFAAERAADDVNVFDALVTHVASLRTAKKRVVIAAWSLGSRDRLQQVLADHELGKMTSVATWPEALALPADTVALAALGIETGFETANFAVIAEQDVLGDRLIRGKRRKRSNADVLTEAASLAEGDLVVHADHGIGRFIGLKTIEAAGAPHDCLELAYHGGDKLFLPVENIELLSRYGSDEAEAQLDRLGGGAWQARKARMKQRIREMADQLIKIAASRAMRNAPTIELPSGVYDEFAARFPYEETDDQLGAIDAVFEDLAAGKPMDRLVCGDVGFGKTEVALRAAFVTAMSGRQVAVVVPTTLLARQHYKTFVERFQGLPIQIAQASRLVSTKEMNQVKAGLTDGSIDIVVGTHALLGKGIKFRDLGLLIVDEEQHFGVKHKERLKELKAEVHVLTLSATPIPRTLQLALTGVRELSLIATPPVDRLAVRTFVSPFDPLVVRETLLRERYRGGQSFYVCPRVSDLAERKAFLDETVPEVKVAVAHGQMPASELEDVMTAFYEGKYDVLLSTTIVESGLDIPTANTLIVHRADMFGLAQLYQIRGRVGRSKQRAYALFTVPADKTLTPAAERRLKVLQSLDTLGAGFQLASHDLDIRGAGNLLGEEQSGHIKEVGYELYQQMLEEAVASLKSGEEETDDREWSPQIAIGTPVMIPESYVPDLSLRLNLYRRLADLTEADEIDAFAAELVDRFGPITDEVEALLKIVYIKGLCRKANVEKVDAGPKGLVIGLRDNEFPNPEGLVSYISQQGTLAKMRPDHRLVLSRDWPSADDRLKGTATVLSKLAKIAENGRKQAA
ncbi:transcription-repair coupling factor [Amorphus sp. 3PC139-8]|uniref:transcription-repair coupling factor n=1 Tax=Amorphus sp. 3PC139-8 TaxID=2735676 RepID=UPI00345D37AB